MIALVLTWRLFKALFPIFVGACFGYTWREEITTWLDSFRTSFRKRTSNSSSDKEED